MADGMDLELSGGKELQRELEKLEKKAGEKVLKRHVRTSTNVFLKAIRGEAPREFGGLAKQTKVSVKVLRKVGFVSGIVRVKSKVFATGRNPVFYQHLVTGGTAPHEIQGPVAFGNRVFARVSHPGAKPDDYVDRGFDRSVQRVNTLLHRDLQKEIMG